ncbi:hypothetical protein KKA08_07435, partial [bacterium]|nr:hypothetical protein [bacterium]
QGQQQEYVMLLYKFIEYPDPFRRAHAQLAETLHDYSDKVKQIDKAFDDEDIFRNKASNSKWKKIISN